MDTIFYLLVFAFLCISLSGCPAATTHAPYPADRWDDMHPDDAGLK